MSFSYPFSSKNVSIIATDSGHNRNRTLFHYALLPILRINKIPYVLKLVYVLLQSKLDEAIDFIEDVGKLRNLKPKTITLYQKNVSRFLNFIKKIPKN